MPISGAEQVGSCSRRWPPLVCRPRIPVLYWAWRLRVARGAEKKRTLELARRAARFGSADEAKLLISRLEPESRDGAQPDAQ